MDASWRETHTQQEVDAVWRAGLAAWNALSPVLPGATPPACATLACATLASATPPACATPPATISSAALGRVGERTIESLLREHFIVRCTTSTAHSGDMHVFIDHHRICVEVKNYTRTVPTTELVKFLRDVDVTAASGGVFVSIGAGISTMPTGFTMRTEHICGRAIPCVYISASDPSAVVVAVQMVADIIRQGASRITYDVIEMTDHVDDLARIRGDLTAEITSTTGALIKLSGRVGSAIASIRSCVNRMRDELPTATADQDLFARLNETPAFRRYDVSLKAAVSIVVDAVGRAHAVGQWRLAPKRCMHPSGVGFSWLVTPDVLIPRNMLTAEMVADALGYGKKATLTAEHLCVEIGDGTLQWICSMILPRATALSVC